MARRAKNKTKAWRRETEVVMINETIDTINEAGETVKEVVQVPHVMKGRALRDMRMYNTRHSAPLASDLLINLMSRAGYVTMVHDDAVASEDLETAVEA